MGAPVPVSGNRTFDAAQAVTVGFYLGCTLILLTLVTRLHTRFLPEEAATQVGHNSETFLLALAVVATIQFARPRWFGRREGMRTNWVFVLAVAAVWLALALVVYFAGVAPSLGTLNEPLAGATLLTVYLGVRRSWSSAWVAPAAIVLLVVAGYQLPLVVDQAETVTSFAAVAVAVDYAQRSILQPRAQDSWAWGYWLFLAACPAVMLHVNRQEIGGVLGNVVNYTARGAEGFWGALLICLFFAALHRSQRSGKQPGHPSGARLA